jgi:uncharacterized protein (TIGR03067 family)
LAYLGVHSKSLAGCGVEKRYNSSNPAKSRGISRFFRLLPPIGTRTTLVQGLVYKRQKETEPKNRDSSPAPAKKADPGKTDLSRIQGVWSVVSMEQGGKPSKLEKIVFMVDGKRACLQGSDGELQGGLYLEPTAKPKSFDLAMSTKTIEGIYSLEGDILRLCYDARGAEESKRPGGFLTEKGSPQVLLVLKRTAGAEVFPFRLPDGTRAFPTLIEQKRTTPLPIEAR